MTVVKQKSRLYRIAVAPKTMWLFARVFRDLDDPHWFRTALRWTWRTL